MGLTRREQQPIPLIAKGRTNKEIANRFCLSEQTVKNHLYRMKHKVGAGDRLGIVQVCRIQGFMVCGALKARAGLGGTGKAAGAKPPDAGIRPGRGDTLDQCLEDYPSVSRELALAAKEADPCCATEMRILMVTGGTRGILARRHKAPRRGTSRVAFSSGPS